jgi:hypothetical protein
MHMVPVFTRSTGILINNETATWIQKWLKNIRWGYILKAEAMGVVIRIEIFMKCRITPQGPNSNGRHWHNVRNLGMYSTVHRRKVDRYTR